ncbi:MAG TPA: heterodisulfide reductase-related iron-sulfur binding cluster [Bryobacteraceae bacterium]|nr:heterodisulfide reductase-related iron-sulfur binding cluster [Bryobacteraceae bacterium]
MDVSLVKSENQVNSEHQIRSETESDKPRQADLDRCVHCGLCLNACPTYRELGVEMDSPRGRIYQMVQVAEGQPIGDSYREHIDLCLACRGCESACPSGVQYGRLVEAARAEIENNTQRTWLSRVVRDFVFRKLLPSPTLLTAAGAMLYIYQVSGLQRVLRFAGVMKLLGPLGDREALAPPAQIPFFFRHYGQLFRAEGMAKYRVALMAGCIANVSFARLNEATIRVLQKNGCDVLVPAGQTCCGALHVHAGIRDQARILARRNIDAVLSIKNTGFDAIITNAAGCGSTLKEYDELFEHDPEYLEKAKKFKSLMKDVTEFLASIELNREMVPLDATVTYQDSCHLAHGQKIRTAPRQLLRAIPGLKFREMPLSDICCGSAGIYNVLHTDLSMSILEKKMDNVRLANAEVIATANPGCMIQLEVGVRKWGRGERVAHVVELLDQAYRGS